MSLDLDALELKHERVRGMSVDWCREDEQDWPCQTHALIARIRELEQQLADAESVIADPNPVAGNVAARVTGVLRMGDAQ